MFQAPWTSARPDDSGVPYASRRCGQCHSPVAWVDASTAHALGISNGEAAAFLGVEDAAELRWWACESCRVVGVVAPALAYWQRFADVRRRVGPSSSGQGRYLHPVADEGSSVSSISDTRSASWAARQRMSARR